MRLRNIGLRAARRMYRRGQNARRINYPWCTYTRGSAEEFVWRMGWHGMARRFINIFHGSPEE